MEHWRKKGEEKRRTHTLLSRILPATIQNAKIEKEGDGKKSACDLFFSSSESLWLIRTDE